MRPRPPIFLIRILINVLIVYPVFSIIFAPRAEAQDIFGDFEGQVVNSQTGKPIEKASVVLISHLSRVPTAKRTDEQGRFYQGLLFPGIYTIRISAPGFRTKEIEQRLLATRSNTVLPNPIELDPEEIPEKPASRNSSSSLFASKDKTPPSIQILSPKLTRILDHTTKTNKSMVTGKAADESGITEVFVRGIQAQLDEEGNFQAEILLKVGENRIEVAAVDIYGNTGWAKFTIYRERDPVIEQAQADIPEIGNYYALVIGNNSYQELRQLKTAENDATEVAVILRERYGFQTKLLLNANRQQIMSAINEYRRKLEPTDNLLIYYAGHGYRDAEVEKAYWLPIDASKEDNSNWISADDVTTNAKGIAARHVLIISDSCYSGTMSRDTDEEKMKATVFQSPLARDRFLQKVISGKSRTLMASGGNEPVTDGGGGSHSVFASALLRGLNKIEEKMFTAEELFHHFVQESVAGQSNQMPEYNPLRNSGHDRGDFVFVRQK